MDYGSYVQMFVSCGGMIPHTVGMIVDPERNGTFVLGYYSHDEFDELMSRYTEVELPESYRQRLLDINTYKGRNLHEVCEDLLVGVIRNGE